MDDSVAVELLSSLSRKKGGFICTYQGCFFAATEERALSKHVRTTHEEMRRGFKSVITRDVTMPLLQIVI